MHIRKEKSTGISGWERDFIQNCQDAPHGNAIFSKFSGCFARERDVERQNDEILRILRTERDFLKQIQDAPHGSAIFLKILRTLLFFNIFRMLCTGARFSSTCSGCPAQERDFERRTRESCGKAIPETSAPYCSENNLERSTPKLVAGRRVIFIEFDADKSTKFRGCSARERDFCQYIKMIKTRAASNCLERERNFE